MDVRYIDIHSHFNLPEFNDDLSDTVTRMEDAHVQTICVGTGLETSKRAVEIAEKYTSVYACIGQHPTDTQEVFNIDAYRELAKHKKVLCVGECGMDYFRNDDPHMKQIQESIFREHILLARECSKPLMIHARPSKGSMDAYEDVLRILKEYGDVRANFHFFVGDITIAKQVVEGGHTMSFDGPITFSSDYDEVIKSVPIESIMVETDAPYAAPMPYRGKRNEPAYVTFIAKRIAHIRNEDEEMVRIALLLNTRRVFGI